MRIEKILKIKVEVIVNFNVELSYKFFIKFKIDIIFVLWEREFKILRVDE